MITRESISLKKKSKDQLKSWRLYYITRSIRVRENMNDYFIYVDSYDEK